MIEQVPLNFGISGWPGPTATTGVQETPARRPVLAIHLDPVTFVLRVPPFPDGEMQMARFCRQLAWAAAEMAARLTPDSQPAPWKSPEPRHALIMPTMPSEDGGG